MNQTNQTNQTNQHIARWISASPDRAILVCWCCDQTVDETAFGDYEAYLTSIGECNATVEQRSAALDKIVNEVVYRSSFAVGV